MKKILTLFILVTVMMLAFAVCAYAEEALADEAVSVSTVYERALEWWKANEDEVTSIASLGATALFGILYGKIKGGISNLIANNGFLVTAQKSSNTTMGDLIVGYNSQVDEIKALRKENTELHAVIEQNANDVAALKREIALIAHILTTVYTNNKALPQGTKNMVTLECAECMRLAGAADLITGDKVNEDIEKD